MIHSSGFARSMLVAFVLLAGVPEASAQGACCRAIGDCEPAPDADTCSELNGVFLEGEDCATDPCGPGACCFEQDCLIAEAFPCIAGGRDYAGAGTTCLDDPCQANVGACCLTDACSDLSPDDCDLQGGTWLGAGTDCSGGFCDPGSCCRPGICEEITLPECNAVGGTFHVQGDCTTDPCPVPGGCASNSLFGQPPDPADSFAAYLSEASASVERADNFEGLVGSIESLSFRGLALRPIAGDFVECLDPGNPFRVVVHEDAAGLPGAALCTYTESAVRTPTGSLYSGFELQEYEIQLPTSCVASRGWISVVGLGDADCHFYWISAPDGDQRSTCTGCADPTLDDDLNLCLGGTAGGPSGACCDQSTGGCTDPVDISSCTGTGSRFEPDATCASLDPPCAPAGGGCCFADGTCSQELPDACDSLGGDWLAAGANCDLCPALGGCCLEAGFCSLETSIVCADQSWTFLGEGSSCADCAAPPGCPADSFFAQPPDGPSNFKGGTSEGGAGFQRFEDFTGVSQPIEALTWWGLDMDFQGGSQFEECVETDPVFRIFFHEDDGGVPGAQVCSYLLTSTYVPFTPLGYFGATLNEYAAILPTPCTLGDGWVSIVGFGDPDCWFLWMSAGFEGTSYCDNCSPPVDSIDLSVCFGRASLTLAVSPEQLSWNVQAGAEAYDVVRGDLETLHETDGNFTLATTACIADDHPAAVVDYAVEPDPESGFWILVRPVGPSANGSYDSGATSQSAPRDAAVDASPAACP